MSYAYDEEDGLRVVESPTDELLHLPVDAAAECQVDTLTCCGQWGEVGVYLAEEYALDDADFCPACAASQELERLAIAAVKTRVATTEPGRALSTSPDVLYATEMDPAEAAYWTALADQIGAANREGGGNGAGLLAWLNGELGGYHPLDADTE